MYTYNKPHNALSILAYLASDEVYPYAYGSRYNPKGIIEAMRNSTSTARFILLVNDDTAEAMMESTELYKFFDPVVRRDLVDVGFIGTILGTDVLTDRVLASPHWPTRLRKWLRWQWDKRFNNADLSKRYIVLRQFVPPERAWALYILPPEVAVLNPRY